MYKNMYKQTICILLLILYNMYQLVQCMYTCHQDSLQINICGQTDGVPQVYPLHLLTTGRICMIFDGYQCQHRRLQRKVNLNSSLDIYLYKLPYHTQKHIERLYTSRKIFLNQVDVRKEESSSTKCLESPTYIPNRNTNCSGDQFVSSIDITGLVTTIRHLQWSSLIFIYDKYSEARVSRLQLQLSEKGITSCLMKFDDLYCENIITELHAFYITRNNYTNFNIVLICSQECTATVLREANRFGEVYGRVTAFHHFSNWLIASPLISRCELEDIPLLMDNVAIFKEHCLNTEFNLLQKFKKGMKYLMNSFDTNCYENDTCYENSEEENRLFIVDYTYQHLKNIVDQRKISISTLAWGPNRRRELRHIGYISKDGLTDMEDDIFPNRKFGFNNKNILVSTNIWEPFVMKKVRNSTTVYYGFCMDILKQLSYNLNFSYTVREPNDKQWGTYKDGRWTGLFGDLVTETVDLVAATISISPDREGVIDFTTPFFYEQSGIGLKMLDPNSTKWKRLLQPFSWQVLLCLAISFVSFSVIFTAMEMNNPYYEAVGRQERNLKSILTRISYLWGALLLHGGQPITQSSSGRTLIGCWWIFCIIMAATYSGNLIAFLTVNKDGPPISSLRDMLNSDEYKWGLVGSSVYLSLFKNSTREDYQKIWNGIVGFNKTDHRVLSLYTEDHLALVEEGSYAFLGEQTPMYLWQKNHNDIVIVNENFYPMLFSFGLTKNSEYTIMFTENIMKMYESGLLQVWKDKWWSGSNSRSWSLSSTTPQIKTVDLLSLQSMFYAMAIGLFLSCTALTVENIINIKRKGNQMCAFFSFKENVSQIEKSQNDYVKISILERGSTFTSEFRAGDQMPNSNGIN